MYKIYVPTKGVEDWQLLLADPVKHWKTGYSAKALAFCWEQSTGFPAEINELFLSSDDQDLQQIEPLMTIPEHKVSLPGGATESQDFGGHITLYGHI